MDDRPLDCVDAALASCEERLREEQAETARLRAALIEHRSDLHQYSKRPCPTCRQSAEALGITDKVPYSCARERHDKPALAALAEVPHECKACGQPQPETVTICGDCQDGINRGDA